MSREVSVALPIILHQKNTFTSIDLKLIVFRTISGSLLSSTLGLLRIISRMPAASIADGSAGLSIVKDKLARTWLLLSVQLTILWDSTSPFGMITSAPSSVIRVLERILLSLTLPFLSPTST